MDPNANGHDEAATPGEVISDPSSNETGATSAQSDVADDETISVSSDEGTRLRRQPTPPVRDHTLFIDEIARYTTNQRGIELLRHHNAENVNDGISALFSQIWAFYSESWTIWRNPRRIAALLNLLESFDDEDSPQ